MCYAAWRQMMMLRYVTHCRASVWFCATGMQHSITKYSIIVFIARILNMAALGGID
jgi:hypothetical protein